MNGQIITVALILLGHIFLTPAVQLDWPPESPDNQYHLNK